MITIIQYSDYDKLIPIENRFLFPLWLMKPILYFDYGGVSLYDKISKYYTTPPTHGSRKRLVKFKWGL